MSDESSIATGSEISIPETKTEEAPKPEPPRPLTTEQKWESRLQNITNECQSIKSLERLVRALYQATPNDMSPVISALLASCASMGITTETFVKRFVKSIDYCKTASGTAFYQKISEILHPTSPALSNTPLVSVGPWGYQTTGNPAPLASNATTPWNPQQHMQSMTNRIMYNVPQNPLFTTKIGPEPQDPYLALANLRGLMLSRQFGNCCL